MIVIRAIFETKANACECVVVHTTLRQALHHRNCRNGVYQLSVSDINIIII